MAHNNLMRAMIAAGLTASAASASAVDFNITGFVRQEIAVSITDEAYNHKAWNPAVDRTIFEPHYTGALDGNNTPIPNTALSSGNGCATGANGNNLPACGPAGSANAFGASRYGDVPFNMFNTRAEIEVQAKFNEMVSAYGRVRAYFDGTSTFTDDNVQMEKHFLSDTGWGDGRGNLLEVQNNDMMLDIPSLYADINIGSAWFRVGQQQIAWGEALFFRVFDVANGLDLRRHLFLDVAAEEFADERVASPGVRASYTFNNGWEVDAFMQMFSPTIYPNTNTPYAVIGQDFTLNRGSETGSGFDDAENTLNFGARLIMPDLFMRDLTVSVMAVNRRNPDGVFRWDAARVNSLNGNFRGGEAPNPFAPNTAASCSSANNNNPIFCGQPNRIAAQPFEQDFNGTSSVRDWWTQAGRARFDPIAAATTAIGEWGNTNPLATTGAFEGFGWGIGKRADGRWDVVQETGAARTACTNTNSCTPLTGTARKSAGVALVDQFFYASSLRGHISREFKRENIFGVSFNYIITADPSSLLDQLIVRGEMSYTPDKKFTDPTASALFEESDEILASVILEKYQSIFESLPATYLVFEWMHRTDSDLGGRSLKGYSDGDDLWYEDQDGSPDGQSGANYLTFAFQQPFPNLIWRGDFAVLADVRGGLFFQPGVRYKPSGEWQFDMYANIAADVGGEGDDMIESFDDMDEVFVRATYYF